MNVLVDTHAILWWFAGDKRLSSSAKRILENPVINRRLVSVASLWEIAIKIGTGGLTVRDLTLDIIVDRLAEQEFAILPIRVADLLQLERLPLIHRDPFDRLLIAQALEENVPLLTADRLITQYRVKTAW